MPIFAAANHWDLFGQNISFRGAPVSEKSDAESWSWEILIIEVPVMHHPGLDKTTFLGHVFTLAFVGTL